MEPKPERFGTYYAEAFKGRQVVDAYRYRPPYPPEVFDILTSLISDEPRNVLDVGAGPGDIARNLVTHVERVDAVDFSHNMIEEGKRLPNGDAPDLHWIYGRVEDVPLSPPYALITAGSSIHWPDWSIAFPRFRSMLTQNGLLALIYRNTLLMPWQDELKNLRTEFGMGRGHGAANAVAELEKREFFLQLGRKETAPIPFQQSIDDFIEGLHSRSGFAKERMGEQKVVEFDARVREFLSRYHSDGMLPLQVVGTVTWGKPLEGNRG